MGLFGNETAENDCPLTFDVVGELHEAVVALLDAKNDEAAGLPKSKRVGVIFHDIFEGNETDVNVILVDNRDGSEVILCHVGHDLKNVGVFSNGGMMNAKGVTSYGFFCCMRVNVIFGYEPE